MLHLYLTFLISLSIADVWQRNMIIIILKLTDISIAFTYGEGNVNADDWAALFTSDFVFVISRFLFKDEKV